MIYEQFNLNSKYPIIFIGSGIANLSCALELSKKIKNEIIILEAGSYNYDDLSKTYFKGELSGENYHNLEDCRYRGFLGTANRWYGWCKPLFQDVFRYWQIEELNNKKYINKALNFFNLNDGFKTSNFLNRYDNFQIKTCDTKILNEKIESYIKNSPKIKVILNTQVLSLERNENSYDLYINQNNKKKKINTNILILGAGCFENSRLLLYSKMKSSKNFLKDHNLIGKKFHDHPQVEAGEFTADYNKFLKYFDRNYKNSTHELIYLRNKNLIDTKKILNHHFTITFKNHPHQIKDFIRKSLCVSYKFNDRISNQLNNKLCMRGILLNLSLGPNNNSNIKLSNTKFDKNGINQVNLNYNWRNDLDLINTYENVTKEFLTDLVKLDIGRGFYFDFETHINNKKITSTYHPSGGTIIASNINNGCVDKNLEVFKNKNLYILGSSVFPRGNIINPTFSIVTFSLRLADRLKKFF